MGSDTRLTVAARTDALSRNFRGALLTRCLHCGSQVGVHDDGSPVGTTTLEHIVPRSWFGHRAAVELVALVGQPDDARNLALACARCNQQKGRTHDARGPADERALSVVRKLLERRLVRFAEGSAL